MVTATETQQKTSKPITPKTMSKRTKKQIKEDAKALKEMNEWSRKVFGYTKNGWLYIDNKPVSYIGEEEEEF